MSDSPQTAYRADIDGLRAVAVLAVVGYHFLPRAVAAGFIGVDVFFVISGYLISGIILSRAARGGFPPSALADFYGRRIRRIFPALLLVLGACLAAGAWSLYAHEFAQLGRHAAGGAGFASNIVLWLEVGYFDNAAETKPLLHLWSLGIEEQFYLLWPLLLAGAARGPRSRAWMTGVLLAASFIACVIVTARSTETAFYLPFFRVWELMAGAALAQWQARAPRAVPAPRLANLLSAAGGVLLVAAFALIDRNAPFPGWRALLPVLAAGLLIAAGPQGWFNRRVLAHKGLVGIGLVSYPLYLWHWPLLSFFKILGNDAPLTPARATALFAVAMALAVATYVVIERPARARGHGTAKALGLAAAMAMVGGLGAWVAASEGLPQRAVNGRDPTYASRDGRNAKDSPPWFAADCPLPKDAQHLFGRCSRGAAGPQPYVLLGDSKADSLFPGLHRTARPGAGWLYIGGATASSSLLPVVTPVWHYAVYQEPARLALAAVLREPGADTVVIAAAARAFFHLGQPDSIDDLPASPFYAHAEEGLLNFVAPLVAAGKQVVLVVDNPTLPDPKRCMANARVDVPGPMAPLARFLAVGEPDPRCRLPLARHLALSAPYHRLLRTVADRWPRQVRLFDPTPLLCDERAGVCGAHDAQGLQYAFSDHISNDTSTRIGQALNDFLAAPRVRP